MKIYTSIDEVKGTDERFAVTIGSYDGVHIGHKKVLSELVRLAKRMDASSAVVTFDPHPRRLVDGGSCPPSLISGAHKLRLIDASGVDVCLVVAFDKKLMSLSAREFVAGYLCSAMNIAAVCVGSNFVFGRDRGGDADALKSMGEEMGFEVSCVPPVRAGGVVVSSTAIRSAIGSGRLDEASTLLGRPYSILGTIIRGRTLGRKLGYPTANIDPHHEAIPPEGVYAVRARVRDASHEGLLYIGRRPTFGGGDISVEVYLVGFGGMIYGEDIEISFVSRIRGDMKFGSTEELVRRIKEDEREAAKSFRAKE